jgi:hypothetical protein
MTKANEGKRVQLSVTMTADERAALERAAAEQHRTASSLARHAIAKALKLGAGRNTAAA